MKNSIQRIELTQFAADRKDVVESMIHELEGPHMEESASDLRWPTRFISAGAKGAPPRWGTRFLAAGPKNAPARN
jgi:hypothetical protein